MGAHGLAIVRFGAHHLELETGRGVHHDPENEPLYGPLAEYLAAWRRSATLRVLDLGCGTGVLGLVAARATASRVTFADVHPPSVASALANARRAGLCDASGVVGDLLSQVRDAVFDLVLFNPPQTGGPPELAHARPDRYGGGDGAAWFLRFLTELPASLLAAGGRVVCLQHSRANPARVAEAFTAAGFARRELARQRREFTMAELDALSPGTGAHQLALRARGAAQFEGPDADGRCAMTQALWVAERQATARSSSP